MVKVKGQLRKVKVNDQRSEGSRSKFYGSEVHGQRLWMDATILYFNPGYLQPRRVRVKSVIGEAVLIVNNWYLLIEKYKVLKCKCSIKITD